jgi:hypothetical protein
MIRIRELNYCPAKFATSAPSEPRLADPRRRQIRANLVGPHNPNRKIGSPDTVYQRAMFPPLLRTGNFDFSRSPEIPPMRTSLSWLLNTVALRAVLLTALMPVKLWADDAPGPIHVRSASATPVSATSSVQVISPGEIAATPEMWFYEQTMRRYDDPKNAVRAAAEFKANQRRARIAAMDWYGYSNLRPASGIDPVDGPLHPQWIGNGYNPYTWIAPAHPAAVWVIPGVTSGY